MQGSKLGKYNLNERPHQPNKIKKNVRQVFDSNVASVK